MTPIDVGALVAHYRTRPHKKTNWFIRDDFAFLGCEKCGQTSLKAALTTIGFSQATAYVGGRRRACFVCRNPYSRMVSVWRDVVERGWREILGRPIVLPDKTFPAFVRWLVKQPPSQERLARALFHTQVAWIGDTKIDHVLRLETLAGDLEKLFGQPVALPLLNAAARSPVCWPDRYDQETQTLVSVWASQDFERFGYSTGLPPVGPGRRMEPQTELGMSDASARWMGALSGRGAAPRGGNDSGNADHKCDCPRNREDPGCSRDQDKPGQCCRRHASKQDC